MRQIFVEGCFGKNTDGELAKESHGIEHESTRFPFFLMPQGKFFP